MAVDSDTLDFTFLNAVNRVLRASTLIRGDDDDVTTFSDTAHSANINLARIALQDELSLMASDQLMPLEFIEGSITTSAGQRVYDLPSGFTRFAGRAFFKKSGVNRLITYYPGGRDRLRETIYDYKTQTGEPNWFYWEHGSRKKVGLYQVPDSAITYTYDYQRSVYVTVEADEMPFHNQEEVDLFCQMATRRFKFLFERPDNVQISLERDMMYRSAKSGLYNLLRPFEPRKSYGKLYL
jgi:hypothetical protein